MHLQSNMGPNTWLSWLVNKLAVITLTAQINKNIYHTASTNLMPVLPMEVTQPICPSLFTRTFIRSRPEFSSFLAHFQLSILEALVFTNNKRAGQDGFLGDFEQISAFFHEDGASVTHWCDPTLNIVFHRLDFDSCDLLSFHFSGTREAFQDLALIKPPHRLALHALIISHNR